MEICFIDRHKRVALTSLAHIILITQQCSSLLSFRFFWPVPKNKVVTLSVITQHQSASCRYDSSIHTSLLVQVLLD